MKLVGVDVGGTFTDIVFSDTERGVTLVHKVPTTPADPSAGVMAGIRGLCERNGLDPAAIDHVFHGTTIATNAVLEHRGARTGMITTRGYRDIIHVARHQRPQHYSIMQDMPWQNRPLVRRRHRKVVRERIAPPRGEVLVPLAEREVRAAARALRAEGVEAIAICFLFSYIDPAHEERARQIVLEVFPDAFVTTSASVSPQFREFERFTTAAMNAFIGPRVRAYVTRLADSLRTAGLRAELHIMASNGGVATPGMVADRPVLTLLSGPAAGVLGGAWTGALSGRRRLITFDVGGTSADIGLVVDGAYSEATARDTWIGGYPVLVPMIDIHSIGAGGGSVAWIDQGGAFRVGPRSAGAQPGPAAYGRGGTEPTVTDANLVLGRLDPDNFLGGDMKLDVGAARRVIADLARRLGLGELEAAEGVLTILNSNMANAIRSRTVQKGIDPRQFSLVAFGGAGPLHGAEVAALLSIPEVIVPPHPGITSAVGLLTTDLKYDAVKTEFQASDALDLRRIDADLTELAEGLRKRFAADGLPLDEVTFARAADLRYVGQGYELRVPIAPGELDDRAIAAVFEAFHRLHEAEYGHAFPHGAIEIVNIRVSGVGRMPKIGRPEAPAPGSLDRARVKTGRCVFRVNGRLDAFDTAFYQRRRLPLGETIAGPAVILQTDSTTVVPPGWSAVADAGGNLLLSADEARVEPRPGSPGARASAGGLGGPVAAPHDHERRVDPVTASVIHGALESIAVEMGVKLMRMSYSSIIRESEDFGAALIDTAGRQLCETRQSTPLQSGPIAGYVRGMLRQLAERGEEVRPGDVIMHNDAYAGASHGPDVAFCVPAFHRGTLVGFSVTTAHHLDIGSLTPGTCGIVDAIDAYAEGLQFKAIKVYDAGRKNDAVWHMLRDNIRASDLVVGDMEAQIAAARIGAERFVELLDRYGPDTVGAAYEDLLDYSERLMRSAIETLPDGVYRATTYIDGYLEDGEATRKDLPIAVAITVAGSDMTVDLIGTGAQIPDRPINMPLEGTVDVAIWLTVRSILLDTATYGHIPQNSGLTRPITIVAPRGSLANPIFPAPTIARFCPGNQLADTVMKALAPAVPRQVSAGIGNLRVIAFSGLRGEAHWVHMEIFEGSYGGRFGLDGMDAVDTLYANTRNNPIEDIESHLPLRVNRYELREDACAAGRWRGGMGSIREFTFLADGGASVEGEGHKYRPWGFLGGGDGFTADLVVKTREGRTRRLPSKVPYTRARAGDTFIAVGPSGGGYGRPLERDPEQVLEDVRDGYISVATARKDYGVAIRKDMTVDQAATAKARSRPKRRSLNRRTGR